jgi:cytochrome c biogenesis protein CcdA
MLALIALALSIGIVDSLNPSTIVPALYLATGKSALRNLSQFIAGAVAVNLTGGVLLTLGPGKLLTEELPRPGPDVKHLVELALGGAAVLAAIGLWLVRERVARRLLGESVRVVRAPFTLGAGIIAVELPTAFPYFAVIAAIVASGRNAASEVLLLVLFNVAFAAPLIAILALRGLAGARADASLDALRGRIHRVAPVALPLLVLAVAVVLLAVGGRGLASD